MKRIIGTYAWVCVLALTCFPQTKQETPSMKRIDGVVYSSVSRTEKPSEKTHPAVSEKSNQSMTVAEYRARQNRVQPATPTAQTEPPAEVQNATTADDEITKAVIQKDPVNVWAAHNLEPKLELDPAPITISTMAPKKVVPDVPKPQEHKVHIRDFKSLVSFGAGITNAGDLGYNRELDLNFRLILEGSHLLGWSNIRVSPQENKAYIGSGSGYNTTFGLGWKVRLSNEVEIIPNSYISSSTQKNYQYEKTGTSLGAGADFRLTYSRVSRLTLGTSVSKALRVTVKDFGEVDEPQTALKFNMNYMRKINNRMAFTFGGILTHVKFSQYGIKHTGTIASVFATIDFRFGT